MGATDGKISETLANDINIKIIQPHVCLYTLGTEPANHFWEGALESSQNPQSTSGHSLPAPSLPALSGFAQQNNT